MKITPKLPVILCFVSYYLPGYQSGGPVRTIANFVDHLGDEFDIRIITRDRDALGTAPYPNVHIDAWNVVGKAQVYYASPSTFNLRRISKLICETYHDLVYLNSYFDFELTTLPLLARRLFMSPRKPCIIAPRGEFSPGAIVLKAWKKRPYMWASGFLGLYLGLQWQASSTFESKDIMRELRVSPDCINVAIDLPPLLSSVIELKSQREPGPLRVVFLSRISPMKNLDYLIRLLARFQGRIDFTVYGPIRDIQYWRHCMRLISTLPANVVFNYAGEVSPEDVSATFGLHDLFVFPTRGENYGHVVLESLAAGTSVLLSNQTPWQSSGDPCLEVLPLDEPHAWLQALERWAGLDHRQLQVSRSSAHGISLRYMENNQALEHNREMFLNAFARL